MRQFEKIKSYIGIGKIGWLELMIALYPILAGYGYGSFQLAFGVLLIIDLGILFSRRICVLNNTPLALLFSFIVLHDILFLFVIPNVTSYYVNSLVATIIYVVSVFIIAPHLDYYKLKSSIMLVAIVCMGGMIYHVSLISLGQSVSPIKLPFLPDLPKTSRLFAIIERPTSFFWEPQSYASFMLVPLFFMLREKKLVLVTLIAATIFVSTSTTGLVLSVLMIFLSMIQNSNNRFGGIILGACVILLLIYFLLNSSYTTSSLEKLEATNIEESNRIINGYLIATDMSFSDLIMGIPFANEQDAYDLGYFHVPLIVMADGVLFISAIWICLIRYGLICTVLFVLSYYYLYKMDRKLLPYLTCILIALFSNPDFIGSSYVFQLLIMLTMIQHDKKISYLKQNENKYINFPVR